MQAQLRSLAFAAVFVMSTACTAALDRLADTTSTFTTPTPTYTCGYFADGYDTLSDCQGSTNSICSATYESFPSGGVANCFFPPDGFAACSVPLPTWQWIYTVYSPWCDTGTLDAGGDELFVQYRSAITCSSAICNCGDTQLSEYCSSGVAGNAINCPTNAAIGNYQANPLTAATPIPLCP